MDGKVFADTNIIIYAFSKSKEGKKEKALKILDMQHGQLIDDTLTIVNPFI